ncbi:hypothetical protein Sjap_014769 [Stephania japonica]|uniref:AP2/ERF domain-containing protein n=1 Tax=Stephania japonica TaxID=461633 RepID=A0AAP0NQ98_9MAGN
MDLVGTFKSDKEAAMAYDIAAMKLRNDDYSRCNIPCNNLTIQEHNFQSLHTTYEILCMIKDGSYQAKFMNFVSTQSIAMESKAVENANHAKGKKQKGFGILSKLALQISAAVRVWTADRGRSLSSAP